MVDGYACFARGMRSFFQLDAGFERVNHVVELIETGQDIFGEIKQLFRCCNHP